MSATVTNLTVKMGDLDGKYFTSAGYTFTTVTTSNYLMTAVGAGTANGPAATDTVTLDNNGNFGGTLLQ